MGALMTGPADGGVVLHVIVPQREGAVGGADLHVLDLAAAQQLDGAWRPVILAPRASADYEDRLTQAGLRVARPRTRRGLRGLIRDHGVGLVHAHGYEANYLAAAMRVTYQSWAPLPLVVTAHGWIETTPWLRVKSSLDRACSRVADVRIATADAHVAGFRFRKGAAVVIRNGIPAPDPRRLARLRSDRESLQARFSLLPGSAIVGTVGRLSPEKRGDLFLEAARQVAAARPDTQFVIAGGGAQRGDLEALAARLGIRDRVVFTGLLRDVTPLYAALDVLVQPSDTEGTPRTVLEAMAHRVPVVATAVGDVADLLDHGAAGAVTPPGDAGALAQEITTLLGQPQLAAGLADRAFARYSGHFTIEAMSRNVAGAYARATGLASARNRT
jgi:glycosyltransferase involved in cell wall biosynthesis